MHAHSSDILPPRGDTKCYIAGLKIPLNWLLPHNFNPEKPLGFSQTTSLKGGGGSQGGLELSDSSPFRRLHPCSPPSPPSSPSRQLLHSYMLEWKGGREGEEKPLLNVCTRNCNAFKSNSRTCFQPIFAAREVEQLFSLFPLYRSGRVRVATPMSAHLCRAPQNQ